MEKNEETEGEDLIADFLEDDGIKFIRYYKLENLKEDDKYFREADFYLPHYNICIEFLGRWNNPEDIKRYKQKMAVYNKNKIPCIYLWPNNLGNLDWIIRRRLRGALLKYNRIPTLIRYELSVNIWEISLYLVLLAIPLFLIKYQVWKIFITYILVVFFIDRMWRYIKRLSKIKKSKWVSNNYYKKED